MGRNYPTATDDDWFEITNDFRLMCCDCSLVHRVNIKKTRKGVLINFQRDPRATAVARRWFAFPPDED